MPRTKKAVKKVVKKRAYTKHKPTAPKLNLMELVLTSFGEKFPNDHTMPSLILSRLKSGEFYVSVARYDGSFGAGKKVMFSAKSKVSLQDAQSEVINWWLKTLNPGRSAIDQLKEL